MSTFSLDRLGWSAFYSQCLSLDDLAAGYPARVTSVQRSGLTTVSERGFANVVVPRNLFEGEDRLPITVGDWVLVENCTPRVLRLVERRSLLARRAAGPGERPQLIAANLDTIFVVTSCNQDFNLSRLERYLALALDAHIEPVIVITKADVCEDSAIFCEQARRVAGEAQVIALNATSPDASASLAQWLTPGRTLALVGSSGVGKSTLINTLLGADHQATAGIREDDARGRHTTTSREMFELPCGAWIIDTPGMREIKIGAVESGVRTAFADVEALALQCRFRNCSHQGDAGCALEAAVAAGRLDARRLSSYLKLQREAARAVRTEHERREIERKFGRLTRATLRRKERERQR